MLHFDPESDVEKVAGKMSRALDSIITGEITVATRSVEIDGVTVREGQVIGLLNGKLAVAAETVEAACLQLLEKAEAVTYELITLFYGSDLSPAEANRIADLLQKKYPEQEVEVQEGGQPHYQFIISIE